MWGHARVEQVSGVLSPPGNQDSGFVYSPPYFLKNTEESPTSQPC